MGVENATRPRQHSRRQAPQPPAPIEGDRGRGAVRVARQAERRGRGRDPRRGRLALRRARRGQQPRGQAKGGRTVRLFITTNLPAEFYTGKEKIAFVNIDS